MKYRSVKGFTGLSQLGVLIAFLGLGFILAAVAQFVIAMQVMPKGITFDKMGDEILNIMQKPENVNYNRAMQVIGTFLLMFVPCWLYMLVCHGKKWFWLGFNKHLNIYQLILAVLIMFVANLLATPLMDLTKSAMAHFPSMNAKALAAENLYNDQVLVLGNVKTVTELLVSLLVMAFLPAMFEEVFFRGALQNLLNRWWKRSLLAVIVSSVIFSFIHMSYYLFISRAVLGFALGWMFYRSKNIWINIFAHFVNNGIALVAVFYFSKENDIKTAMAKTEMTMPVWTIFLWTGILVSLFILFEKVSEKNRTAIALKEEVLIKQSEPFHDFPPQQNLA